MIELKPRAQRSPAGDPDGIRVVPAATKAGVRTRFFQTLALLLVAGCVGYVVAPRATPPPPPQTPDLGAVAASAFAEALEEEENGKPDQAGTPSAVAPATSPTAAATRPLTPRRKATQRPSKDPVEKEEELPVPNESMKNITGADYIQALHDAGIYTGIGAFPPPGTKPPMIGLAVPEDYELPEGYVRHHQATDDGQDIEPILMYSPDYEFFDADGNPLVIPEDRVVRPEYAPPGVPIREIVIPEPRDSLSGAP